VHEPRLLILDEPFQGLDPVNVDLIRRCIVELVAGGTTVVLSAHQMHLVEALCHRIALINRGRAVLYGPVAEIRRRHSPGAVRLRTSGELPPLAGVVSVEARNGDVMLTLGERDPQSLLRELVEKRVTVEAFEVASASLEEIFLFAVRGGNA
jgi:ABC-2 type transport system ATP-binding protein